MMGIYVRPMKLWSCKAIAGCCVLFYAARKLPISKGLVGWFTADSFNPATGEWLDWSGSGNHATISPDADVEVRQASGQALNGKAYLRGSSGSSASFPASILPQTYTVFHIARYDGPAKGRILSSMPHWRTNWYSGFDGGVASAAQHIPGPGRPAAAMTGVDPNDWLVSTDQVSLYRSQGVQRWAQGQYYGDLKPVPLCIGCWPDQPSDWAVAAVLVYNWELPPSGLDVMEEYLHVQYGVRLDRARPPPCEPTCGVHAHDHPASMHLYGCVFSGCACSTGRYRLQGRSVPVTLH